MLLAPRFWQSIPRWQSVTEREWSDWRWQFRNRIADSASLHSVFPLTSDEQRASQELSHMFRMGITPHYATLIDPDDRSCPIRLQVIPRMAELTVADYEAPDPLHEDACSPVPGLMHKYPDRALLVATHECALYCRYCTRRRIVGDHGGNDPMLLRAAIDYIEAHREIRDVLISGGDPLGLSDARLEDIVARVRAIAHVEIIRIGTRMPVVAPQRITQDLVAMLSRYHPLWLNTHFNHPFELAPPATKEAMERLVNAGIPTGNQTVLLRGVNDCPIVMRRLMHELVKLRCRPYYLYSCDLSEGLSHFRTPVATGLAIMESLHGHTSGYAVPTFVVDGAGAIGKVPLSPDYVVASGNGRMTLRNYRGDLRTQVDDLGTTSASPDGECHLCHTHHEEIKDGPAAELWARKAVPAAAAAEAATTAKQASAFVSIGGR